MRVSMVCPVQSATAEIGEEKEERRRRR